MKPDNGNGVVLIDRSDYYKKMDDILSDMAFRSFLHRIDAFNEVLSLS